MTVKISELPVATEFDSGDVLPIVQGGSTKQLDANGNWTFGAIDGTPIGGSTPSTGAFSTLTASDDVNFDSGTLFVDASADAVGIGTTAPNEKLVVSNTGDATLKVWTNTSGGTPAIEFQRGTNATWGADNFGDWRIKNESAELIWEYGADGTAAAERMRIDSSGHAIIPAGVTLGTAAGVYNAANTLDDYEEGTWTPTVTNAPSATFGTNVGYYTKIGNAVTVNFFQSVTNYNGGSGDYRIGGLPFTPSSTSIKGIGYGALYGDNNWSTSYNLNNILCFTLSSGIISLRVNSGSNAADITIANVGTNSTVASTITYFID